MIGTVLIKDDFKLSAEFKWRRKRKTCFWRLDTDGHPGRFRSSLGPFLGSVAAGLSGVCVFLFFVFFFRAAGFLHRVKTINCIPQNLCHSHLCHVLNGAPLQVIRFLSSLRRCGSSVYAEKTKVSAAGNINTHWICHGGHFPGRIKKKKVE